MAADAEPPSGDAWDDCPPGALVDASRRLKQRRRTRRLALAGGVAAAAALLLAVGMAAYLSDGSTGPLECVQVAPHLAAYDRGELDTTLRRRIAAHLRDCPRCRRRLWEIQQGEQSRSAPRAGAYPVASAVATVGR